MTLTDVMEAIERDEFAAEMNLAAGTRAFRRCIRTHNLFARLIELAKGSPVVVADRVESISHRYVDTTYENRFDAALSAYLMALSDVAEPKVVCKAAQAVLRTPKCWWALGLARELVSETAAVGALGGKAPADAVTNSLTQAVTNALTQAVTNALTEALRNGLTERLTSALYQQFPGAAMQTRENNLASLAQTSQIRVFSPEASKFGSGNAPKNSVGPHVWQQTPDPTAKIALVKKRTARRSRGSLANRGARNAGRQAA